MLPSDGPSTNPSHFGIHVLPLMGHLGKINWKVDCAYYPIVLFSHLLNYENLGRTNQNHHSLLSYSRHTCAYS